MDHLHAHASLRSGDYAEISISPPDHMQYFQHPLDGRLVTFRNYWKHRVNKILYGISDHCIFIEISSAGRLHMHGLLKIDDPVSFYHTFHTLVNGKLTKGCKFMDRCEHAVYKIKSQPHFNERVQYISKDYIVMQEHFNPIMALDDSPLKSYILKHKPKIDAIKVSLINLRDPQTQ